MSVYEHWSLIWSALSSTTAAITLIVVIVAATFTYHQIREASKSRQMGALVAVLQYIDDPDLRSARTLLYNEVFRVELANHLTSVWSEDITDHLIRSCSNDRINWTIFRRWLGSLENISMLVMHDLAHDDVIGMFFSNSVRMHWRQLRVMIDSLRGHYGSSDFLQHLEMLNRFIDEGGFDRGSWARSRLKRQILRDQLAKRRAN